MSMCRWRVRRARGCGSRRRRRTARECDNDPVSEQSISGRFSAGPRGLYSSRVGTTLRVCNVHASKEPKGKYDTASLLKDKCNATCILETHACSSTYEHTYCMYMCSVHPRSSNPRHCAARFIAAPSLNTANKTRRDERPALTNSLTQQTYQSQETTLLYF